MEVAWPYHQAVRYPPKPRSLLSFQGELSEQIESGD